jgi:hypothetical protein
MAPVAPDTEMVDGYGVAVALLFPLLWELGSFKVMLPVLAYTVDAAAGTACRTRAAGPATESTSARADRPRRTLAPLTRNDGIFIPSPS